VGVDKQNPFGFGSMMYHESTCDGTLTIPND